VLTMYNDAAPDVAMGYYDRCAAARARGHEVYIHTSCQPLSFDFTLREPYLLYSHDAFDRVTAAGPEERAAIYRDPAFRQRLRENFRNPKPGILFYGDWSQVELDGVPVTRLSQNPLDFVFDLPLDTAKYWRDSHIVWAGPREMPEGLRVLVERLHLALYRAEFILERRPFAAHVTLLRKARKPTAIEPLPRLEWPVREFALVNSDGGAYADVERFRLEA